MKEEIGSGNGKKARFIGRTKASERIYNRKGTAVTMSLILLLTAFISFTAFFPTVSAQTQIPTYYGWSGYNGNYTIYMSTSTSLGSNPYALPSKDAQVNQGPNAQLGTGPNGIVLSTTSITTAAGTDPFNEQYNSNEGQLIVTIPTIVGSGTNQTRFDDQNTGAYNVYGVALQNLSISASGLSSVTLNSLYTDSSALNLSIPGGILGGSGISKLELAILNQSLLEAVALLGPEVLGYIIPYINLALLATEYGATSKVILGGEGFDSMTAQNLTVNPNTGNYTKWVNETGTNSGYDFQYGENVLASEMIDQLNINASDFVRTGYVNISGVNYLGEYSYPGGWTVFAPKGAAASLSVPAVPAYTITGTAYYSSGAPVENQALLLESPSANYYIYTNSTGQYRFFAQPGVNYFLTSSSANIGGVQIDPSATDTSGGNYNLYITTATFSESGLSGQSWSVKLAGPLLPSGNQEYFTSSSTGSSITFSVAGDENYQYSVGVPTGYTVSSSSGFIDVGTTPYSMSVTFTRTPTYTVTITESGLPSGTLWSAKLGGTTASSTSSSISFYSVPDGTYSWSVPYVYYSTTLWYEPSPGSGTITVNGNSASVSTTFYGVPQSTTSCVYALAPVLLANNTFQYAEDINVGESIMTYNFTSNTMESGTVQAVYVTQHSDMFVINGYLKVANDQDIWTNHGYIQAQNLTSNDTIFDVFNHQFYKVHSISVETGNFTMYDFYVSENHNYIVWSNLMQDRLP